MKLVAGLGNPGRRYEGSRHNVGFEVLAQLAKRYQAGSPRRAFKGECAEIAVNGERTLLLWPHTLMNLSGGSVLEARDFYKLENEQLLVVCDDFNLPLAKLRMRPSGSAGGQRGLEDVVRRLGTDEIPRLRIGVGPLPDRFDAADFVLSKFKTQEQAEIELAIVLAADAVVHWIGEGISACMNRYN